MKGWKGKVVAGVVAGSAIAVCTGLVGEVYYQPVITRVVLSSIIGLLIGILWE